MAEKPILNQAAINAANVKNAAALAKQTAAQKRITELTPQATSATNLTGAVKKYVDSVSKSKTLSKLLAPNIESIKSRTASTEALFKSEIFDPLAQANTDLTTAAGMFGDVPEAKYASEDSTSAYDLVTLELTRLGLPSLIGPLKEIFESGITGGDSLRLALSQRPEYQTRFSANAKRIAAGLSALSPAEYIQLEDQYQNVMRNYGLPASYYAKDATGKQIGFDDLLAGDVSSTELEERLITAQDRVLKSNPEVLNALKTFYPGIEKGDILAYSLDPKNALKDIQRKVAAAEIGGAALAQGLTTSATGAEELAGYGVTKDEAQKGFINVAQMAPRGGLLSEIYNEAPYNQATATAEVFGTAGAADAAQKRRKLTALEEATFSGQSGLSQGALARNGGGGAF